jgi:hypothetical protein
MFKFLPAFLLYLSTIIYPPETYSKFHSVNAAGYAGMGIRTDTVPEREGSSFFVSSLGSDTSDGKSASTPKLTITGIEASMQNAPATNSGVTLNLNGNSLFREEFNPSRNNTYIRTVGMKDPKSLAKFTGMDVIRDWTLAPSFKNVYQHMLKHSIETGSAYANIIVAEIDTTLEKTNPVTAVRYLTLVSDPERCNNQAGTFYTPNILTNPCMVYMHPSEGAPGANKFRYEVTTRNHGIYGYLLDGLTFENLFLQSSGHGIGMLGAGTNSTIKNVIFQGGGIHHTVIKSGQMDSCLFLPGPKGLREVIAAVFYDTEGKQRHNRITNTIFLDVPSAVYSHTLGSNSYKSLVLDKVYAFADSTTATYGLTANDTDSIEVTNCYVEGYPYGWWFGGGSKLSIKNSLFIKTNQAGIQPYVKSGTIGEVKINNVLITTNANDYNQNHENGWVAFGIRAPNNNARVEVSNTIIHCYSTWHGANQAVTTYQVAGALNAHHNIYICDVNDENSIYMNIADNSGGRGTSTNVSSNNNAFILLRGSKFNWMVSPNNSNGESSISTLPEWQFLTGQDKNSIVIDLRNNPLGLKAIFVDPEHGNWTLAQTLQADSIRRIGAGMTAPPLFYPKRPLFESSGTPFQTPGGFSTFTGSIRSETEAVLQWQTFNESQFSTFNVQYSFDKKNFMEGGTLNANNDGKNHDYQYIHTHQEADSIFYRVRCVNTDSTVFYSSIVELKDYNSFEAGLNIFPNPFQQSFTVRHPRKDKGNINIFDYSGRLIKVIAVTPRASKTLVNLPHLPSGRYFVQWVSNQEKLSGTIIKFQQ